MPERLELVTLPRIRWVQAAAHGIYATTTTADAFRLMNLGHQVLACPDIFCQVLVARALREPFQLALHEGLDLPPPDGREHRFWIDAAFTDSELTLSASAWPGCSIDLTAPLDPVALSGAVATYVFQGPPTRQRKLGDA